MSLVLVSLISFNSVVRADDSAHSFLTKSELVQREVATRQAQEKVNEVKAELERLIDLQRRGLTAAGEKIRVASTLVAFGGFFSALVIVDRASNRGEMKMGARTLAFGSLGLMVLAAITYQVSEQFVSLTTGEAEGLIVQLETANEKLEQEKAKLAEIRASMLK